MTVPHEPTRVNAAIDPDLESTEQPAYVDGIPVAELVRAARELTNRITNEDRKRYTEEITESGHQRSIQTGAPYLINGWFTGKLDLDVELTRRFPAPPLLSSATFAPKPGQFRKHGFAQFASQDAASVMTMEIHNNIGALDVSFLHYSMIGVRFTLGAISQQAQKRTLELLERPTGIVLLWTRERWEHDYLIFVVREGFARLYAFGPGRVEAACRLTPEGLEQLRKWLGGFWNPPPVTDPPPSSGSTPNPFVW